MGGENFTFYLPLLWLKGHYGPKLLPILIRFKKVVTLVILSFFQVPFHLVLPSLRGSKTMVAVEAEKIAAAEEDPKKRKRTKMATATEATRSNLPEDLWERIFKLLNDEENNTFNLLRPDGNLSYMHSRRCRAKYPYHVSIQNLSITNSSFRSLSLVSKQFLSITNGLRFLVKISEATIPFLNRLFERFPNITSLNITLSSPRGDRQADLGEFLAQISTSRLDLKSLTLYHPVRVPVNELRALSKKMKNLTSLTCYQLRWINKNDLLFIADYFPLLEELILTDTGCRSNCVIDSDDQFLALPKLRRIALTHTIAGRHSVKNLCKNCDLQEVKVVGGCSARYAISGPFPRCHPDNIVWIRIWFSIWLFLQRRHTYWVEYYLSKFELFLLLLSRFDYKVSHFPVENTLLLFVHTEWIFASL